MRLALVRSGGFAGLSVGASLDTEELSDEEAREIFELAERVDLEALARRSPIRGAGADRYQYDLTVSREGGEHRVSVGEGAVPPELAPLLDRLLADAGPPGSAT